MIRKSGGWTLAFLSNHLSGEAFQCQIPDLEERFRAGWAVVEFWFALRADAVSVFTHCDRRYHTFKADRAF
jgi:hypothetical protein